LKDVAQTEILVQRRACGKGRRPTRQPRASWNSRSSLRQISDRATKLN